MKNLLITFLFVFATVHVFAQEADRITGIWWNEEKTSKIEVKREVNGSYSATIVYLVPEKYKNGAPPKDDKNLNPYLRDRSILGLLFLTGLRYDAGEDEWVGGHNYDPESGKTYDCYVWMEDCNDILFIKNYVAGIRWLGRSTEWTRTTL
jgi:uncharacterized protein (DUF2147 family)